MTSDPAQTESLPPGKPAKARTLPPRPRRKRRWFRRILLTLLVLLVVAYFTYSPIASRIIASKVREAVESRLHAQLRFDELVYTFPYQVRVKNLHLVNTAQSGNDTLLTIAQLDFQLAKLPLPKQPMVIRNLSLENPSVSIVRTPAGVVGSHDLKRPATELQKRPPRHKLSEMFELRQFAISGGSIVYDDRRDPQIRPMAFRGIDVDLGITPETKSLYKYQLATRQAPFVQLNANGTMDIDALVLDLEKLALTVQSRRFEGETSLPPRLQQLMSKLGVEGSVSLTGRAKVPFREVAQTHSSAQIVIKDARGGLPDHIRIDQLDAALRSEYNAGQTKLHVDDLTARSGAGKLTLGELIAQIDMHGWKISSMSGAFDAMSPGPTSQPAIFAGTQILAGTMTISGEAAGGYSDTPGYAIVAKARDLSILPRGFTNPIGSVNGDVRIYPESIEFPSLTGILLDGRAEVKGKISLKTPIAYEGDIKLEETDLAELSAMPLLKGNMPELSGRANLTARVKGEVKDFLDRFTTSGQLRVHDGKFWEIPILAKIIGSMEIGREALTLGEGAALFSIENRIVTFQRAAITSPVLGVQGKGTISFNGDADLSIIAAPLGNWREHIQKTRIPLVSNLAGQVAGQLQKMVSSASRMLYQFDVKGKLSDPQITPVPAPLLTETAAGMFGKMLQGAKDMDLLKGLEEGK